MLIAFEGLDQSGKETQTRQLRARLEQEGWKVRSVSFPDYETPIGRELAQALQGQREFTPDVMQLLYVANRFEYRPRLESWLAAGDIVLCDRYLASSVAYGEAHGLDAGELDAARGLLGQLGQGHGQAVVEGRRVRAVGDGAQVVDDAAQPVVQLAQPGPRLLGRALG